MKIKETYRKELEQQLTNALAMKDALAASVQDAENQWIKAYRENSDDARRLRLVFQANQKAQNANEHTIWYAQTVLSGKLYANEIWWSDVTPNEVIEICTPNKMIVRSMKCVEKSDARQKRIDSFIPGGFCGHFDNNLQEWDITPDPKGCVRTIRKHKDGRWYDPSHQQYRLNDHPINFYDYNF